MTCPRHLAPAVAAIAALVAALSSPCGAAPLPPAPRQATSAPIQAALSHDWKRLPSTNFTIVGTASAGELARLAGNLETFRAILQQMTPSLRLASPVPTYVVAFKDWNEFSAFQPRGAGGRREEWVGGYFSPGVDGNYLVTPWGGGDERALAVLLHEFTHYLVSRNLAAVPTWLSEGLAEFYSTFRIDEGRNQALIGEPPRDRVTGMAWKRLMPLDRLTRVAGTAGLGDRPEDLRMFYAQSWALVHYLFLGQQGARTKQIGVYMQCLGRGESLDLAFATAFGATYDELGKELEKYIRDMQFPFLRLKPAGPGGMAPDKSRVEAMSEADAEALQAGLLWRMGAVSEAEAAFKRALALRPTSLEAGIALVRVRQQLAPAGSAAAEYEQLATAAARAASAKPLDASAQYCLSLAALAAGREAESDAALEAALRLNPDAMVLHARAYAAFALGRDAVTARDVRAFLQAHVRDPETVRYMFFLGALALRRLDKGDEAARLLDEARAVPAGSAWGATVLDYMQGKLAAAAFLGGAKDDGQRTEAHTYIGFDDELGGRREAALGHFRWVKEKGSRNFVEYPMAVAELARLEQAPAK